MKSKNLNKRKQYVYHVVNRTAGESNQEFEKPKHRKDDTKRKMTSQTKVENDHLDGSESIEQSQFVVTREHQKEFDQNYLPDCTFQGKSGLCWDRLISKKL